MKLKHVMWLFVALLMLSVGILCLRPSWVHAEPDAPASLSDRHFLVAAGLFMQRRWQRVLQTAHRARQLRIGP